MLFIIYMFREFVRVCVCVRVCVRVFKSVNDTEIIEFVGFFVFLSLNNGIKIYIYIYCGNNNNDKE